MFELSSVTIEPFGLRKEIQNPAAGAYASFEGWVRNHHEGRDVSSLEYEAYAPLAEKEGKRVLGEALKRFDIHDCRCVHRVGQLPIGEIAIAIGVSASHRDAAFDACRYIIDEVKARVPIWKKEFYPDGTHVWVRCHQCAKHQH